VFVTCKDWLCYYRSRTFGCCQRASNNDFLLCIFVLLSNLFLGIFQSKFYNVGDFLFNYVFYTFYPFLHSCVNYPYDLHQRIEIYELRYQVFSILFLICIFRSLFSNSKCIYPIHTVMILKLRSPIE
jgi:hypothetical protein